MSEATTAQPPTKDAKRLATLTAQFALRGFAVHEAADGYMVTRWNLKKHVPDLDSLERFARVVEAA